MFLTSTFKILEHNSICSLEEKKCYLQNKKKIFSMKKKHQFYRSNIIPIYVNILFKDIRGKNCTIKRSIKYRSTTTKNQICN